MSKQIPHRRMSWAAAVGLAGVLAAGAADVSPATFYVNNRTGNDAFDGRAQEPAADGKTGPFASIMKAVRSAPASAHIEISNTGIDYRERVRVDKTAHGRPAAPFVIDGHGATVTGLVKVPPRSWTLLTNDVFGFRQTLPDGRPGPMPNSNWLGFLKHQGWFTEPEAPEIFFVNGEPGTNVLTFAELPPGGFFYDTLGTLGDARRVYFRLPAGAKLDDLTLEMPLNEGVFVDADYVVIRNLRSIYSQDDGFAGFWGYGDIFENIDGSFNCDQGFSMHGNSATLVDGALFERNGGAGIVDVMSSVSIYRNIVARRNLIGGALFQGSFHSCRNSQFTDNAGSQVSGNRFELENCLVRGGRQGVGLRDGGRISRCTVVNAGQGIAAGSGTLIEGCLLVSNGVAVAVAQDAVSRVKLTKNVIGLGKIAWGAELIGPEQWGAFASTNSASVAGNIIASPALDAPLHPLPKDSPLRQEGTFGAALKEFSGWKPLD